MEIKQTIKLYKAWKNAHGCVPPYRVELLISSRCNSRCLMCNVWKLSLQIPNIVEQEVTFEEYKRLFAELSEMGVKTIAISGGEPTMRMDIIDIIREAKCKNFYTFMVTNGSLINKKLARDLISSGLDALEFSIDSPVPEIHDRIRGVQGFWKKAIKGIKLINQLKKEMQSKKPNITITYVINKLNYHLIYEMMNLKEMLECDYITFIPVVNKVKSNENLLLLDKDDLKNIKRIYSEDRKLDNDSLARKLTLLCEDDNTTLGYYGKRYNKKPFVLHLINLQQ